MVGGGRVDLWRQRICGCAIPCPLSTELEAFELFPGWLLILASIEEVNLDQGVRESLVGGLVAPAATSQISPVVPIFQNQLAHVSAVLALFLAAILAWFRCRKSGLNQLRERAGR